MAGLNTSSHHVIEISVTGCISVHFKVLEILKSKIAQKSLVLFIFDISESIFKSARTLSAISTIQARQIT